MLAQVVYVVGLMFKKNCGFYQTFDQILTHLSRNPYISNLKILGN